MKTEKIVVNIDEVRKRVNSPKEILEIGGTSLDQFKKGIFATWKSQAWSRTVDA